MGIRENKKNQLLNEIKPLVKKANQRINRIEKTLGVDSWAVKRLRPKIDNKKLNAITDLR